MPKMHKNTLGGRAPPGPAGGAYAFPRAPRHNGGLLLRGTERREGGETERKGTGRDSPPEEIKVSRMKHWAK